MDAARRRSAVLVPVLAAKTARTFSYGALGVIFPLHLAALGLGPGAIGGAVTATLVATALLTLAIRRPVERWGPRPVLLGLSLLIVAAGLLLVATRSAPAAILAAMLGNLAVSTGETGPFLSIEQVLLASGASGASSAGLTRRMSLYNLIGYAAAGTGSLTVALAARGSSPADPPAYAWAFWLLAASGVVQAALYGRLPPSPVATGPRPATPPASPLVRRLAALFALDALAGGFVVQSLVAYWLALRFGLDLASLGSVFAAAQALTVASLLLAPMAAARLGLVETMVFSHLISNLFLLGLAVAPTARVAVTLLLLRQLLSQIDVPTRQAFLMGAVTEAQRPAAATLTNAARTSAQAISPAFTGLVMQTVGLSAPFALGGALKIVYDLLLYRVARQVARRAPGGAPAAGTEPGPSAVRADAGPAAPASGPGPAGSGS
jgi:MFS family permease